MNKILMKLALMDANFVRYFEATSGIQLFKNSLISRDELIECYTATTTEWLALQHLYLPKPLQVLCQAEFKANLKKLLKTMTLAEVRMMGKPMSEEDVQAQLRVRDYQTTKLWRYYVTYLYNLPPQHPDANKLHKKYPQPWVDTGLPHLKNHPLAA